MSRKTGPVILLALGLASTLYGAWLATRQSAIRSWPTTQGTVVTFDPGVDPTWEGEWYANPKLTFTYEVQGQTYESVRLNPSPFNYQRKSTLERDTAGFTPGATIPVWYDAAAPEVAYAVNRGVTREPTVLIGGGALFVILGVVAWRRAAGRS